MRWWAPWVASRRRRWPAAWPSHRSEADEADSARHLADVLRELVVGFVASRTQGECLVLAAEHQFLEGVVGARAIIAGKQLDGDVGTAQFAPVAHLTSEQLCHLSDGQGAQRVVRMDDDRQTIDGDDLLRLGAAQVAQLGQGIQFTLLDGPRGGCQVGAGIFQPGEAGAGTMRGHLREYRPAIGGGGADALFVLTPSRGDADV